MKQTMKRYLQHILTLSLLLIIPTAHSFLYGQNVKIKRLSNGTYYDLTTSRWDNTAVTFSTVAEAIGFNTPYYVNGNRIATSAVGLQDNDKIVLLGNTNETGTITISNSGIEICSEENKKWTITATTTGSYSNNCLLYINGGSVTIDDYVTLNANANNGLSVVRLAETNQTNHNENPIKTSNSNMKSGVHESEICKTNLGVSKMTE